MTNIQAAVSELEQTVRGIGEIPKAPAANSDVIVDETHNLATGQGVGFHSFGHQI